MSVSSLGSLCLRLSRLSWRSRAMMAAMEKSVAQGRAEQSSSMAGPRSRPSPCNSIKLASEPSLPPAHTPSPSEHPIGGTNGHNLCNLKLKCSRLDAMLTSSTIRLILPKFTKSFKINKTRLNQTQTLDSPEQNTGLNNVYHQSRCRRRDRKFRNSVKTFYAA